MLKTKRIGITGGIGSGKTTVCNIFGTLGIPIYNADQAAKDLMNNDPDLKDEIIQLFGKASYDNQNLNRAFIADQVFKDKEKLDQLNAIVHPAVFKDLTQWFLSRTSDYAIYESALIFQGGSQEYLDFIIYVYASAETRINRVMKRDHANQESVAQRIQNQPDPIQSIQQADFVIVNEAEALIPQVLKIHRLLIDRSQPLTSNMDIGSPT